MENIDAGATLALIDSHEVILQKVKKDVGNSMDTANTVTAPNKRHGTLSRLSICDMAIKLVAAKLAQDSFVAI